MSTRYKRTNWVRRLEDFSSGCSSGFGLGQCLIAGILAIFSGISRLLPVTRWLSVILSPDVPVVSTTGASSLKSPASIWRGVVFVASVVGLMAMGRGAWAFSCSDVTEIPKTECEALVALYDSTDGDNWKYNTAWKVTNTPCSWYGVTCSDGNITQLVLSINQLSGTIPSELGNLLNLTELTLYRNRLSGTIPPELGKLVNLTKLALYRNILSGTIPSELGNLVNLTELTLYKNQLSGTIPSTLGNLTNLTEITLYQNKLSGTIPSTLGNLTNLTEITLHQNKLSGTIPSDLGNLITLQRLSLSENQLSGTIPTELGNLTNLQELHLYVNQLTGTIPPELGNLINLQELSLGYNQLTGNIPPELGDLINLQELHLGGNQLNGNIPPKLDNLINLQRLSLSSNQLGGPIPTELGNLTNLQGLYLNENQLNGTIPSELGNLNLQWLDLTDNQLSGPIPAELGNLTNLQWLNLTDNQLSGSLPLSLMNLNKLISFSFEKTELCEPVDTNFQTWLAGVVSFSTGVKCGEECTNTILNVSTGGSDTNGNGSESAPFATIQHAINTAKNCNIVLVQPGTYVENIKFNAKNITVKSTDGAEKTVIDGNKSGSVVVFKDYNYRDTTNKLNGFTLTNGQADEGGGIYCRNSSPIIENVIISNNSASHNGGGIQIRAGCDMSVINTTILGNQAPNGGGIYSISSSPTLETVTINGNSTTYGMEGGGGIHHDNYGFMKLTNVTISDNSSNERGGGLAVFGAMSLTNVTISNNSSDMSGGGIYKSNASEFTLKNVLVTDNSATDSGGGIAFSGSNNVNLMNITMSGNKATKGGGMYFSHSENLNLVNSILWNNSPQEIYFTDWEEPNINLSIAYSNVEGGQSGIVTNNNKGTVIWLDGNIDVDPLFENGYHLSDNSHLINAGTSENAPNTDIEGNPRDSKPDIGAYENASSQLKLSIEPSALQVCNGDSFDVIFQTMIEELQSVDTVAINLGFDPATLKFNSLTNSGVLDFEMTNKHDNGSIEFTAGVWDNPVPTQTFDMFTVNFTAQQATETTLTYDTSKSSLTSEGESILYFVENGQLTVSNCFGYQVDLQRKNPKPDNSWETALEISIGSQTNATKYNDTSDQNGQGNIAVESTLGNQDYICVKNAHTLANKIEAPIDINNIVDFGTLLEGDSNGDNVLSVNDFSQVFQSKGKCTDDTGFNANADFNVDGCVTMDDAKFLKESPIGNLGKTSACTWNSSLSMLRRGTRDGKSAVTLGTTTIPTGLTVGDTFDYVIKVQAGTQLVDTTGAYLNFDPKLLKVNTILQGETFDFVLQSSFDNELGNIDFAAGVWDHEIPKGTFTLVTINFTVLSVGGEETLSFNTTGNRVTTTVSGGSSVTAQDESGEPVIEEIEEPVIEEPTGNYTASGIIRDKEGNPIAGVNVQVGDKTAVTNDKGEWEITGLQEGDDYTATASKDGYTFAPIEFALGNDEFTQTVVMKPLSALNVKVIAEPSAPKQGENITFIATVTNGGSETATGVALTNVLSNGISLVSIEALDGGECDTSTVTCTLPDLTTGATAKVKLAVNNSDANKVANEATVTSNEYPADVHKKSVNITPHLSVSVNCAPKTVEPKGGLHCTAEVVLSSLAPSAATGINLVMTLPNGVELQSLNTDYGMCDTSEQPILTCSLTDLSVDSPDDISRVAVSFDSVLQDPGLLALTHAAKVTANEYPAHTTRARTKVFIPPEYQVDLAIVIDVTGSMQQEMNSTKNAVNKFIADLEPSQVPLTALVVFRDEVTVKAVTTDLSLVETAINKMKASGGGTCPEASVEALDVAITHVKEGGTIFFVTDASPYEDADVAGIVERMKTKGIIFNAIVTGDCSNKESWNVLP